MSGYGAISNINALANSGTLAAARTSCFVSMPRKLDRNISVPTCLYGGEEMYQHGNHHAPIFCTLKAVS